MNCFILVFIDLFYFYIVKKILFFAKFCGGATSVHAAHFFLLYREKSKMKKQKHCQLDFKQSQKIVWWIFCNCFCMYTYVCVLMCVYTPTRGKFSQIFLEFLWKFEGYGGVVNEDLRLGRWGFLLWEAR